MLSNLLKLKKKNLSIGWTKIYTHVTLESLSYVLLEAIYIIDGFHNVITPELYSIQIWISE